MQGVGILNTFSNPGTHSASAKLVIDSVTTAEGSMWLIPPACPQTAPSLTSHKPYHRCHQSDIQKQLLGPDAKQVPRVQKVLKRDPIRDWNGWFVSQRDCRSDCFELSWVFQVQVRPKPDT